MKQLLPILIITLFHPYCVPYYQHTDGKESVELKKDEIKDSDLKPVLLLYLCDESEQEGEKT